MEQKESEIQRRIELTREDSERASKQHQAYAKEAERYDKMEEQYRHCEEREKAVLCAKLARRARMHEDWWKEHSERLVRWSRDKEWHQESALAYADFVKL